MRISPTWLREFVTIRADERTLANDLTMAGIAVESIGSENGETIFEMEITTNRVDAMNHYGVARECAAIYDVDLRPLEAKLPAAAGQARFQIELPEPELCRRYTARIVRDLKIGSSPAPVQNRLELMGSRGINNAADATNYNLQELGHPTHAFDLDLLQGGKIIVRRARDGERLTTLDGVERTLSSEDLVIADANRAVALAGVMGGLDTMITEKTRNVLIESAWFDPVTIRKTARRLGMHTDASHRFERGADLGATLLACDRVAQHIIEWGGGKLEGDAIDALGKPLARPAITLRFSEVARHLGKEFSAEEIARILRRLGFGVSAGKSEFTVELPTWRLDIEREIDLIEEIARIHGYNNFANTLPSFAGGVAELPDAPKNERLRTMLLALGYDEAVSLTFIARDDARAFSGAEPVEIANPLNDELAVMRTSLVPSMVAMIARNLNRGTDDARLFEASHIFERAGAGVDERKSLCLGLTGSVRTGGVEQAPRPLDFYDLKGNIESLLDAFEHQSLYFDSNAPEYFHPGRSARAVMDGKTVASFGQLHPDVAAGRKLRQPVLIAEIMLERLYEKSLHQPRYTAIPRFPAVERDFSFLFDAGVTFERIRSTVDALRIAELRSFEPAEIFRGTEKSATVPAGKYSVLLRATLQAVDRTLRDEEVAGWSEQIVKALEGIGGKLRS